MKRQEHKHHRPHHAGMHRRLVDGLRAAFSEEDEEEQHSRLTEIANSDDLGVVGQSS